MNRKIILLLTVFVMLFSSCGTDKNMKENTLFNKDEREGDFSMSINIPMTQEDYNRYYNSKKDNISVIELSQISVISGQLSALDCFWLGYMLGKTAPPYTEKIPNGTYDIKASVADYGDGGHRIAAVKIGFTGNEPVNFKMALCDGQDISNLADGRFYGFGVDAGLAVIGDTSLINDYFEFKKKFEDENQSGDFYSDHLEAMLEEGHKKYPQYHEELDFIDYVIPETENHILICQTGWGDGTYPVYFGYSDNNELCCAVIQFIFPNKLEP